LVDTDELQILLNLLGKRLTISYPLYSSFELLSARVKSDGCHLKMEAHKQRFESESDRFGHHSTELPTYNDLVDCLLCSGVIGYENQDGFNEFHDNFSKSSKRVFFCPDTNILYHRFLTNSKKIEFNKVAIVDIVKDEIKTSINYKYSTNQIKSMKKAARFNRSLLDEFYNRGTKKARKAKYIALRELKDLGNYRSITSPQRGSDKKEKNDAVIVSALKSFEKEGSGLPVLLTADNLMADLCSIEEIEHYYFKHPYMAKVDLCDFEHLRELIFTLATVFGLVQLNSVLIYGEFGGKARPDLLKLKFLNEKLYPEFNKHLSMCRELQQLDITR